MRIVTGLEVVKENLLKNEMGIGYVQDAIDYIEYLEKENDKFEEDNFNLKQRVEQLENKYECEPYDTTRY